MFEDEVNSVSTFGMHFRGINLISHEKRRNKRKKFIIQIGPKLETSDNLDIYR